MKRPTPHRAAPIERTFSQHGHSHIAFEPKENAHGIFRTSDRTVYRRDQPGMASTIRRVQPKVRGKAARKAEKAARRQQRPARHVAEPVQEHTMKHKAPKARNASDSPTAQEIDATDLDGTAPVNLHGRERVTTDQDALGVERIPTEEGGHTDTSEFVDSPVPMGNDPRNPSTAAIQATEPAQPADGTEPAPTPERRDLVDPMRTDETPGAGGQTPEPQYNPRPETTTSPTPSPYPQGDGVTELGAHRTHERQSPADRFGRQDKAGQQSDR